MTKRNQNKIGNHRKIDNSSALSSKFPFMASEKCHELSPWDLNRQQQQQQQKNSNPLCWECIYISAIENSPQLLAHSKMFVNAFSF